MIVDLRELLKKHGMTQYRLAQLIGVSSSNVGSIIRRGTVNLTTAIKIADALNISLDELVGRDFPKNKAA